MVQCKIVYNGQIYIKIYDSDHFDVKREVNHIIDPTPLTTLYDKGHIILYTKDYVADEKIIVGEDKLECLGDLMIDYIEIYCNTVEEKHIPISGTADYESIYYIDEQTVQDFIKGEYNTEIWYIDNNNYVRLNNYYLQASGVLDTKVLNCIIKDNTFTLVSTI